MRLKEAPQSTKYNTKTISQVYVCPQDMVCFVVSEVLGHSWRGNQAVVFIHVSFILLKDLILP